MELPAMLAITAAVVAVGITVGVQVQDYIDHEPPHYEMVCKKSHSYVTLLPMMVGKTVSLVPITHTICDLEVKECVVGEKYEGKDKTCH